MKLTIEQSEAIARERFAKGEAFGASTGICGNMTYGYGELSDCGYWEYQLSARITKELRAWFDRGFSYRPEYNNLCNIKELQ